MKKFFMALLKGIGYFLIYYGVQSIVGGIWGGIKGMAISMKYAAQGANLMDPEVMKQYMDEVMQVVAEITVPATIVSDLLALVVVALIFVCRKKKLTKELSLRKFSVKAVLPLVLAGLGLNVLTTLGLSMLPEEILAAYEEASSMLMGDVGFWTVILTVVIAPVVEEVFIRGLVYSRMKKGMPMIAAMILSSALFGVLHGQWVWMIYAALLGMLLVWIFERTQSLYACILFHFSYNGCAMLQGLIPETAPDWAGYVLIAAAVVFTAVGLFLFFKVPKAEIPVEEVETSEQEVATETVEEVTETL